MDLLGDKNAQHMAQPVMIKGHLQFHLSGLHSRRGWEDELVGNCKQELVKNLMGLNNRVARCQLVAHVPQVGNEVAEREKEWSAGNPGNMKGLKKNNLDHMKRLYHGILVVSKHTTRCSLFIPQNLWAQKFLKEVIIREGSTSSDGHLRQDYVAKELRESSKVTDSWGPDEVGITRQHTCEVAKKLLTPPQQNRH
ncbi:uncharacterized protein CIMG_13326 [Coccidioides immitis RS]|uniref:Uncharacterized protein n=1 Tax=Coccidioides immitis (strain RS) TaxID=246410 RepID=A0A0D8JUA0_COCIM|nr:uncharacterized protein CIMG_13326 [Coccidioides immitis RS]KJF60925.1 hypothetical protein CIMG_13326 [Coccidioides immitis RS]